MLSHPKYTGLAVRSALLLGRASSWYLAAAVHEVVVNWLTALSLPNLNSYHYGD